MRRADGTLACWGDNPSRQLGVEDAVATAATGAIAVPGVSDAVDLALGGGEPCGGCGTTCILHRDGTVLCWGAMVGGDGRRATLDLDPGADALGRQ